jgi:hypothetical protein
MMACKEYFTLASWIDGKMGCLIAGMQEYKLHVIMP